MASERFRAKRVNDPPVRGYYSQKQPRSLPFPRTVPQPIPQMS